MEKTKEKNGFLISCEEANHNCDKSQYREASLWEKVKLNIHLLYCRACRKYSSGNSKLTKLMKNDSVECMKDQEKKVIKEAFNEELAKNN